MKMSSSDGFTYRKGTLKAAQEALGALTYRDMMQLAGQISAICDDLYAEKNDNGGSVAPERLAEALNIVTDVEDL